MNLADFPRRRWLAAAALALAGASPLAWAQADYPTKPIKIIVNFPPGGAADQIARTISQPLEQALRQPVIVENRGGANGNIGADAVAKAAPDGYTLLMSSGGTISINPHLYAKMPFDPNKDLVPVVSAGRILVYLEVHPKVPVNTAQEFIQYVKANPGKLSFGSPGTGSSPHLAGELFKQQAGVFAVHVPYRGGGPAIQDLVAGQLDFMFDPGVGLQHVKAGKLKLLAIGSSKRSPEFPNVPTMDEVGLKGFDADTWFGFYAPGGTPPAIIAKLNAEIGKIVKTPAFATRMTAIGGIPEALGPEEFAAQGHADSKRFGELMRIRGIKGD